MKKLLFVATAAALTLVVACKKEKKDTHSTPTETAKQRAVAIYFGGTWCPPCGAYGKPAKEKLMSEVKDDAVLISCQVNSASVTDPMNNADANAFAQGFGVSGVPTMFIGGANGVIQGVASGTAMGTNSVNTANNVLALKAFANISGTATISGSSITVNTTTKFFQDQTEEYQVGAYVTEDGISATQASDGSANKNIHDHVLRTKLSSTVFGESIGSNFKNGDTKTKSFTGTLNSAWNTSKLHVVIILWRKNTDGKITICNGFSVKPN